MLRPRDSYRNLNRFTVLRSSLIAIMSLLMSPTVADALKCRCTMSTDAAHCSNDICEIKPRDGKEPVCVFVQKGGAQHYACIRMVASSEMGCRAETTDHRIKVTCLCRNMDYCNVDITEPENESPTTRNSTSRQSQMEAEEVPLPVVQAVEPAASFEFEKTYDLLGTGRDPETGVAAGLVDFESIEDDDEDESDMNEERSSHETPYRPLPGIPNGDLLPLPVRKLPQAIPPPPPEPPASTTTPRAPLPSPKADTFSAGAAPQPVAQPTPAQLNPLRLNPAQLSISRPGQTAPDERRRIDIQPSPIPFHIGHINSFMDVAPKPEGAVPAVPRLLQSTNTVVSTTTVTTPTVPQRPTISWSRSTARSSWVSSTPHALSPSLNVTAETLSPTTPRVSPSFRPWLPATLRGTPHPLFTRPRPTTSTTAPSSSSTKSETTTSTTTSLQTTTSTKVTSRQTSKAPPSPKFFTQDVPMTILDRAPVIPQSASLLLRASDLNVLLLCFLIERLF